MRKLTKTLSFALILTLVLSIFQLPVARAADQSYQTEPSTWAAEDVQMAYYYGLIDDSFLNDFIKGITREESLILCDALYEKLSGKALSKSSKNPFKDTSSAAVLKAYTIGLAKPDSKGKINPNAKINKGEALLTVYNTIKAVNPGLKAAKDIKLTAKDTASLKEPLLSAVKYLYSKGIIKGGKGNLGLKAACTRQEFISIAKRTYDLVMRESGKASKGLFYKVAGGKSTVYILGSIHIADASIYPLNQCIEDAYSKADYLAVEANIKPSNEELLYLQQMAVYTNGDTIDKHISAETYKAFSEVMKKYGLTKQQYDMFKPWYAGLLAQNLGVSTGTEVTGNLGPDMYFLSKGDKKVLELEGIKFQVDMLNGFSTDLQEGFLAGSLEATETENSGTAGAEEIKKMLAAWKNGDLNEIQGVENSEDEPESIKEFNDKFWNERNLNMAEKVKGFANDKSGKTYFVVFGAGHLTGDTGVIKTLESQGYKVEQILK
ncbi:MAG TPA: TraB/GumN family protein [Clostridia bacterium]|nr:TraB/GumN family protein [Clostridia bacterium]